MTIGAKLSAWLDERTGHKKLLAAVLDEPIPGGARWAYVFGATLALLFVVEAVTENHDRALLPGMFVTAQLPVG